MNFGRVPRCARVGVLRATLSLRCFATLRTAHAPSACLTQSKPRTSLNSPACMYLILSTHYLYFFVSLYNGLHS
ncbi:MAG: hypothetical protein NZ455_00855 [Bacteroidia bacterium]|nr:hypothetical protein [Bacteroidia bacterium]MDW8347274.1 hypothetical protein [Bacteroidia bacterium]